MAIFVRLYRRTILRHFGGTKNCMMFFLALFVTIYIMDRYIFNKQNFLAYRGKGKSRSENGASHQSVKKLEPQAPPENEPVKKPEKPVVPEIVKPVEPKISNPAEPTRSRRCGATTACPDGKYTYYIKSGIGRDGLPTVCFNGYNLISPEKKNADRGINLVVINDKTLVLEDVRTFDVYVGDAVLERYLKLGIQDGHLVFLATLDEASYNLRVETRSLLKLFGSSQIDKLKFRDNFVMIGQKGLNTGNAIEKFLARGQGQDFGEPVEINGCLSIPLGKVEKVPLKPEDQKPVDGENIRVGEAQENCGIVAECGSSAFSVQLYTGHENKDMLKMCVNGKYVFSQNLNDAGRGLNIAVVNPTSKEVYRIGHFDTFEADTSNLELFLEIVGDTDVVLVVSHDEASTNINLNIQREFQSLGSQFISKLSFRDAWVFAGQRGIVGKSPIEEISYAGSGWPRPIDKKLCVPTVLKGIPGNTSESSNTKRQMFCRKYRDNSDFCAGAKIDFPLLPMVLKDKGFESNEIFKIPIIVVPAPNECRYNDFRLQLEALLLIPGLNQSVIMVYYTESIEECGELAGVFNFKTVKMSATANITSYDGYLQLVLEKAWKTFSAAEYLIVLEENVIPSPDILSFFAQCFPVLKLDESLIGISAWNENGYDDASSRPDLVYRTETFPGLGFILKKLFYNELMKDVAGCCSSRSWNGWLQGKLGDKEMLVPDVSRAFRKSLPGSAVTEELFGRKRVTSLEDIAKISDVSRLTKTGYEDEVNKLIESSTALDTADSAICLKGSGLGFNIPDTEGKVYSVYYEQTDIKDQSTLSLLAKCFQLFYVKDQPVRGIHHGMLRFSYKKNIIFLIGSATEYYKHKPSSHQPVPAATQ